MYLNNFKFYKNDFKNHYKSSILKELKYDKNIFEYKIN